MTIEYEQDDWVGEFDGEVVASGEASKVVVDADGSIREDVQSVILSLAGGKIRNTRSGEEIIYEEGTYELTVNGLRKLTTRRAT